MYWRKIKKVVLLSFTLYTIWSTTYYSLGWLCEDKVYSYFYKPNIPKLEKEHELRTSLSERALTCALNSGYKYPFNPNKTNVHSPSISIGILTVNRPQRYFLQTLASLLSHMTEEQKERTRIVVIVSGTVIAHHKDAFLAQQL